MKKEAPLLALFMFSLKIGSVYLSRHEMSCMGKGLNGFKRSETRRDKKHSNEKELKRIPLTEGLSDYENVLNPLSVSKIHIKKNT